MPNYRRNRVSGGMYFFTVIAHQRHPLFDSKLARQFLREAIQVVQEERLFVLFAICLLPDHLHAIWRLPEGDDDYPTRWRKIKEIFTSRWLDSGGWEGTLSASRKKKGERGVWQRRYWEHTVNNESDLKRCVDYTHWNPRKHNLVRRINDWPYSSFFRFVDAGEYDIDWGGTDPCHGWSQPDEWGDS